MHPPMVGRIGNAEAILISAIDRNKGGRRVGSQPQTVPPRPQAARFSGPLRDENRTPNLHRGRASY
jgi:hypothetical protein